LEDGTLVIEIDGVEGPHRLRGVDVPQPPSAEYVRFFAERLPRVRRLRCDATDQGVRIEYLAWQDKSGDVWEDVADVLFKEGLVRRA
jgi:hypothetical protein